MSSNKQSEVNAKKANRGVGDDVVVGVDGDVKIKI